MLYHWQHPESLLHEIEVFNVRTHEPEALIHTPTGASAARLHAVEKALSDKGYLLTPDFVDNKYVLRVQQFGTRDELFSTLASVGAVAGEATNEVTDRDPKSKSFGEKIKDNSVTLAGVAYLLGDALLTLAGIVRKDAAEISGGLIWGSTGVVLSTFGKKKPENQMGILYRRVGEYLQKEGVDIPTDEREVMTRLSSKNDLYSKTVEWLYDNPVGFNNTVQAIGGLSVAQAGRNQNNPYKTAAGLFVATGQTIGMVLPEKETKKPEEGEVLTADGQTVVHAHVGPAGVAANMNLPAEKDARNIAQKAYDWFIEKPLRICGLFTLMNNAAVTYGAWTLEKPKVDQAIAGYNTKNEHGRNNLEEVTHQIGIEESKLATMTPATSSAEQKAAFFEQKGKIEGLHGERDYIEKTNLKQLPYGIQPYHLNTATSLCYVVANILYGLSSKDTGRDLKKLGGLDEVYGVLAQVISTRPKQEQAGLVQRVAGFLSEQQDVKQTPQQVAGEINRKLSAIEQNPWSQRIRVPAPANIDSPSHSGHLSA